MQEQHFYDYAVIRVVPKVEREEFINIGLIVLCKRQKFLRIHYQIPVEKIRLYDTEFDTVQLQINLDCFEKICAGDKKESPIAAFEITERFRWLTAIKSSSIQTSKPHSGFSSNLETTFEKLYKELVL